MSRGLDEIERKILRALKASGLSLQHIADRLNAEKVPTLSGIGRWHRGTR
jgi:hypothetical protein